MDKMQEEALRRVREMQSGASRGTARGGAVESPAASAEPQPYRKNREVPTPNPEKQSNEPPGGSRPAPEDEPGKEESGGLFKDKEKLLILLLIMLLSQEGTNTELVLALLYIII